MAAVPWDPLGSQAMPTLKFALAELSDVRELQPSFQRHA